jgi:hypothetical protein
MFRSNQEIDDYVEKREYPNDENLSNILNDSPDTSKSPLF